MESRDVQHDLPRHRWSDLPAVCAADRFLFTMDPEVALYGVRCLRIVSAGFLFYGYAMVLTASFNGAGDTRTPTIINLVCLWMWEIPLAWALAHPFGFGPTGVFIAVSVAFSTMAFVSGWLFSKGMWKTKRV